jgi:hypothetical protein
MAYKLYNYNPSGGAAIPVAALFGLATVIHIVQMFRTRSWYIIPFTIGGVCESSYDRQECSNIDNLSCSFQSKQPATCAGTSTQPKRQTGKRRPILARASLFSLLLLSLLLLST